MATITIIPASIEKQKLRVAAYCRVSTNSADQLHSYAAQIRAYTEMITARPDWELVDIYADEGLTGTRMDKRDEFNRMISDCHKGKIDKIIVKAISRFARNAKDCLVILRELQAINVYVQFEDDNIDTGTLTSEMMVSVFSALAQQESISISQNLRMSYQRRMQKGEFLTANPPLGYKLKDGCQLEVDPESAETVRWIFQTYLDGKSSLEIANMLMEKGILTSDGSPKWYSSSVRYILSNEKYIGDTLCQKNYTTEVLPFSIHKNHGKLEQYYLEGSHEAIISRDVFEKVRKLRATRAQTYSETHTHSPFWKKLICAKCGRSFLRRVNENGYAYFVCQNRHRSISICDVGRVPEAALYDGFVRMYNCMRRNEDILFTPALEQLDSLSEALHRDSPELAQLNMQIADTAEQHYRITKLISTGRISQDICIKKQDTLEKTLRSLKNQRQMFLKNNDIDSAVKIIKTTYGVLSSGPTEITAFDDELFAVLIDQIVVRSSKEAVFRLFGGIEIVEPLLGVSR